jgi:hypothetical protein
MGEAVDEIPEYEDISGAAEAIDVMERYIY